MVGKNGFAVMPIDFTGVRVGEKDEAGYLADKDADTQKAWNEDKASMNQKFSEELIEEAAEEGVTVVVGPGQQPFVVWPKVTWMEPGFFTGFVNAPSEVDLTLKITSPDGAAIDEIHIHVEYAASMYDPAIGGRLRNCAAALGDITADYLAARVKGEG
jgi:sugar phosphate isomerase/epimerase